jgi:N4-gp56 family major capsid protein
MTANLAYGDVGIFPRINIYAEPKMLMVADPIIVLGKLGMTKVMPRNKSQTIEWRRAKPFAAVTTPIAEGVTPNTTKFAFENVRGTLRQYGMVTNWTDIIEDTHEDPVVQEMVGQMGDNFGRTIEALNWAKLRAGTNVYYANGSARAAVNTTLTLNMQRRVVAGLKRQKAKKKTSMLAPSVNYQTRAVEAAYVAVAHTDLEPSIRDLPSFVPTSEYGSRSTISPFEIGSVEEVRYITSPDLDPFLDAGGTPTGVRSNGGSAADVYPILYFGEEAFGTVALRGYDSVKPTLIPAGTKTKDDPLGQKGVAGWKTWHECVILNQSWMARLEVAAPSLL